MALAIDASSPARASSAIGSGVVTTASFDPPVGLIVACVCGDGSGDLNIAITNNGGALTWTEIARRNGADAGGLSGLAQAYWTTLSAGRTGMTVTGTNSTSTEEVTVRLYVVTGANATPIGAVAEGSSATQATTTTAFTTVGAASLGFVVGDDYSNLGQPSTPPTSSDTTADTFVMAAGGISGLSGYKTLGASGSSATFAMTSAGSPPVWDWVSFEVLAAAAPDTSGLRIPIKPYQFP